MEEFLDDAVGSNVRLIPDLLRSLKRDEQVLRGQLVGDAGVGADEWLDVVSELQSTLSSLHSLRGECESLLPEVCAGPWLEGVLMTGSMPQLVQRVQEVHRLQAYSSWLTRVHSLSHQIEGLLASGGEPEAVQLFVELCGVCEALEDSKCAGLQEWVLAVSDHFKRLLKEQLSSKFSSLLSSLHWPQLSSAVPASALEAWDTHLPRFRELFVALMELSVHANPSPSHSLPLPLDLMVKPLTKRFRYHFMEDRKTNNLEKPEWYLTQVSNWLRDHTPILEERVQPLMDHYKVNATEEFCSGVLRMVVSKLEADMREMVLHDQLMAHLVDELLFFEKEVRLSFPSPQWNSSLSLLPVLLDPVPFDKWRSLEKAYAAERLKELTSSETAWSPCEQEGEDSEDSKVPQCTEALMMLVRGMTERYKFLHSSHHQLLFLELQVDLLLEFHQDLSDSASRTHTLHPQYAAYFNASHYIAMVLKQWGEEKFFLKLLYSQRREVPSTQHSVEALCQLRKMDQDFRREEGSVFEAATSAFCLLVEEMEGRLVAEVVQTARVTCRKYKAERWHKMSNVQDQLCMQVSAGAADLLTFLGEQLLIMEQCVSATLFSSLLETLSQGLDQLLITDVILPSSFTDGGVEQLDFDLKHYLIPSLARYCDDIVKKQLFEKSREAVALLSLLPGSAQLLDEVLSSSVGPSVAAVSDEKMGEAIQALSDIGVNAVSPTQARKVLKLKIYRH